MKRTMNSQNIKHANIDTDTTEPNGNIDKDTVSVSENTHEKNRVFIDQTQEECLEVLTSDRKISKVCSDWLSVSVKDGNYSACVSTTKSVPNVITLSTSTNINGLTSTNTKSEMKKTECDLQNKQQFNLRSRVDIHRSYERKNDLLEGNDSTGTIRNIKTVSKSFQSSGVDNSHGSSMEFTNPPNVNSEFSIEHTECGSLNETTPHNGEGELEKIIIDGKPYAKSFIDSLDDEDSIVAFDEHNNQILFTRPDETEHETRVRRLNNILAQRIMNFIREIHEWEDTLKIEFRNFKFSDQEWAYQTLETVACDVMNQKVLVASLNTDCLMQTIKGCESIRTAHWLRNFANYEGRQYILEPKGNLCSRKYKLYSQFCLDQSVE